MAWVRVFEESRGLRKRYRRGMVRVALLYPSSYEVAMSSAVFHRLFYMLSDVEDFYVERFVLSEEPRGLEEGTPLGHFDYIVSSIHYELDYVNLVRILMRGGIEPLASKRRSPRLIVGGPAPTANPEPLAEIADVLIIGELEPVWKSLVDMMASGRLEPSRGIYVPSMGKHDVERAFSVELGPGDPRRIYTPSVVFPLAVEAVRSCPFNCLFCMESYISKPFRARDVESVLHEIRELHKIHRGRVALVGLTINAHRSFRDLLRAVVAEGLPVSLPSMRAELLGEEDLDLIAAAGQETLTVAPETSERLRYALGKEIPDSVFLELAGRAFSRRLRLKVYGIVGIHGERAEDLDSFAELIRGMKARGPEIYLSLNPLVIKPQTPLQWLPMKSLEELSRSLKYVEERTPHDRFSYYNPFDAVTQAAIALGDRDMGRIIVEAAIQGGGRGSWRRLAGRGAFSHVFRPRKDPLPWSHVKGPPGEDFLRRKYVEYVEKIGLRKLSTIGQDL